LTKEKILVVPCGTEIGLEISRSLNGTKNIEVWGANSISDHGKFVYRNYIEGVPFVDEEGFVDAVKNLVKKNDFNYVFPAHDTAILKLKKNEKQIGCKIVTSPLETCKIARHKRATYLYLKNKVKVPQLYEPNLLKESDFPVFIKPDIGQGSKGTALIKNYDDFGKLEIDFDKYLVCEYLPGAEYTVDCFTDCNRNLLFSGVRIRNRILNGISVNTRRVIDADDDFEMFAEEINRAVTLVGAWFFQIKRDKFGRLTLLEFAPRIAGAMALHRSVGVNFAELSLYTINDQQIKIVPNSFDIEMDRALNNRYKIDIEYENVYLDFDDCLVVDGKINTQLISFIYQCVNERKKVFLISRHSGDLYKKLSELRLDKLFDDVYHITDASSKSKFITSTNSIFIDDSFSERKEVQESLGIFVFSIDSVEALL
jgi:hypothetical protein